MTRALYHPERLAGVCKPVAEFFVWWASNGPWPLVIAPDGGLRTDEKRQAELFATGKSKARTLAETPHGRGGAADAYPAVVVSDVVKGILLPTSSPEALTRFAEYGELAEAHHLCWGGRWTGLFPPHGDMPHVEDPAWRGLVFPLPIVTPYPPKE